MVASFFRLTAVFFLRLVVAFFRLTVVFFRLAVAFFLRLTVVFFLRLVVAFFLRLTVVFFLRLVVAFFRLVVAFFRLVVAFLRFVVAFFRLAVAFFFLVVDFFFFARDFRFAAASRVIPSSIIFSLACVMQPDRGRAPLTRSPIRTSIALRSRIKSNLRTFLDTQRHYSEHFGGCQYKKWSVDRCFVDPFNPSSEILHVPNHGHLGVATKKNARTCMTTPQHPLRKYTRLRSTRYDERPTEW